ncbi:phospholipase A2 inhibitor PIP [Lates calcarifer]|uniref:Phospholipase A2 inhibitor PIP n=1 Tax=Lates calcarifer TaxID=8187 RepID=A0AAJ8BBN9_LATCA|nr:phospholipase A2 inhibitor PIP [Lates calcarifer]
MKLLLTVCLTSALLYKAELLRCHTCANEMCSNSTSVECPALSTACMTVTAVVGTGSSSSVTVNKNCSSLLSCITPINTETEWSVNQGFIRVALTQICCITDNCNFQTLATPSSLMNGKLCPACASSDDSLAGTCNATLSCVGVEDSCFSGNTTSNSTDVLQLGCISRNICSNPIAMTALFGFNHKVTCGAPWSIQISAVLLAFALTVYKVLV